MATPFRYDQSDHYWVVGDQNLVFSSKRGDYFPSETDPEYLAWLSAVPGRAPTRIDTEENLGDVLVGAIVHPVPAAVLAGYQEAQARRLTIQIVAKAVMWCVNQIRANQGQTTLNAQQFKQFLKGLRE